jgi:DNA recombination-dependent growth factor C
MGTIAEYSISSNLLEAALSSCPKPISTTLTDWVKGGATATLFLNTMTKPLHGRLYTDDSGFWELDFLSG